MTNGTPSIPLDDVEGRMAACKTFVEQTKLLMSLASAFVFAPAIVQGFIKLPLSWQLWMAEGLFVLSVLSSYVVLGSIAGTQYRGEFDVHRRATRVLGMTQFFSYVGGLIFFAIWFLTTIHAIPST